MKVKKIAAILLSVVLIAGMSILPTFAISDKNANGVTIKKYTDLKYGDGKGKAHKYDLYVPKTAFDQKNVPLILHIHGGGFDEGDKYDEDNDMIMEPYLDRGYIVANVNYTLLSENNPGFGIWDMNEEIAEAMNAVAKKIDKLGLSVKQMATIGYSAGGCLAMLYAYTHADDAPYTIRFVSQGSGPADFTPALYEDTAELTGRGTAEEMMAKYSGYEGDLSKLSEREIQHIANQISPAHYVTSETVPTCMIYGDLDLLVPPKAKNKLIRKFEKFGVKYDLYKVPYAGHLLLLLAPDYVNRWQNKSMEYCDWYFVKPTAR